MKQADRLRRKTMKRPEDVRDKSRAGNETVGKMQQQRDTGHQVHIRLNSTSEYTNDHPGF